MGTLKLCTVLVSSVVILFGCNLIGWERAVTVSFDSQGGGEYPDRTISVGDILERPDAPTRDGYLHIGWFLESQLDTQWDFATDVVMHDMILYAGWEVAPEDVTVVFNSHGGSEVASQTVAAGNTLAEPESPVRTGYDFAGWYADRQYTHAWDFAADTVTEPMSLHARWQAHAHQIVFAANGGSPVPPAQTVAYDELVESPTPPTRTGYTFVGWYSDTGLTIAWDFASDTVSGDMTLYAKWSAKVYTVSFVANDGSPVDSQAASYGELVVRPSQPTRIGYTFGGWYRDSGLNTAWDFASDTVSADTILYAKWNDSYWVGRVEFYDGNNWVDARAAVDHPAISTVNDTYLMKSERSDSQLFTGGDTRPRWYINKTTTVTVRMGYEIDGSGHGGGGLYYVSGKTASNADATIVYSLSDGHNLVKTITLYAGRTYYISGGGSGVSEASYGYISQ